MKRGRKPRPFLDRVAERIEIDPVKGCHLWCGQLDRGPSGGYGEATFEGRTVRVHREVWRQTKGEIPPGVMILHRCDVRRCCNIDHLFAGTKADNTADMMAKGRHRVPRGSDNPAAKLTEAQVLEIRSDTRKNKSIAPLYGVSAVTISKIKRRLKWAHLP